MCQHQEKVEDLEAEALARNPPERGFFWIIV
jgi:hypothetical protein